MKITIETPSATTIYEYPNDDANQGFIFLRFEETFDTEGKHSGTKTSGQMSASSHMLYVAQHEIEQEIEEAEKKHLDSLLSGLGSLIEDPTSGIQVIHLDSSEESTAAINNLFDRLKARQASK